jgi:transposase
MSIMRIGLDLAKNVFEIYGIDTLEKPVLKKTIKRTELLTFFCQLEPCEVGMESCGGAHYWARELEKFGHKIKMMAPQFVAPYRKGSKNDQNDAQAICEAAGRPNMRFIPVKNEQQQAVLALHRVRSLLVGERTAQVNQIRGLLLEFGVAMPQGRDKVRAQLPWLLEDAENGLPLLLRELLFSQYQRLCELDKQILESDRKIDTIAKQDEKALRIMKLEGIGPITATAMIASVGDIREFQNGRQFAAWLGLVPRQWSSGGKNRLGRITKRGDVYLRTLLVHGARAVIRFAENKEDRKSLWIKDVKARRGFNKAAVALAAKHARIVWSMLINNTEYRVA